VGFATGADVNLAITPTNTVKRPRLVNIEVRGVLVPAGGSAVSTRGSGVAGYSQVETRLANSLGETPAGTLARLRALLTSRGYRDATE
jgi:hypothetical protein